MGRIANGAWALALTVAGISAHAEEERVYLTKAEVEQMLVGHQHTFKSTSNSSTIKWDLRPNGTLYYNNLSFAGTGGGSNGSGTWEVKDSGQLCVTWNRSESGSGGCNYFFKVGEKISRSGGNKPDSRVNAEVLSIN